jgi:16S rRNA (guanine1516-N2)-methyltransferase
MSYLYPAIVAENESLVAKAKLLAERWQLPLVSGDDDLFQLQLTESRLQLIKLDEPKLGAIYVDFLEGAVAHRRKFGGGRGQQIAKAVGLKSGVMPTVLDATAGLGRDAFVLASLGCTVTMFERSPVVAALLDDGLLRAAQDPEIGGWVSQRLILQHHNSVERLGQLHASHEIVYLDPMFPHRKKSAQIKKEMRVFQSLVGSDDDADQLLPLALNAATKRVVVKRPSYAGFLNQQPPSMQLTSKANRFDVYVKAAMV